MFDTFFAQVNKRHNYKIRSASNKSYTLPKVMTNYGTFNIIFSKGLKAWNLNLGETFSILKFEKSVTNDLVKDY